MAVARPGLRYAGVLEIFECMRGGLPVICKPADPPKWTSIWVYGSRFELDAAQQPSAQWSSATEGLGSTGEPTGREKPLMRPNSPRPHQPSV